MNVVLGCSSADHWPLVDDLWPRPSKCSGRFWSGAQRQLICPCCFIKVFSPTAVTCDVMMMMAYTSPIFLVGGVLSLGCASKDLVELFVLSANTDWFWTRDSESLQWQWRVKGGTTHRATIAPFMRNTPGWIILYVPLTNVLIGSVVTPIHETANHKNNARPLNPSTFEIPTMGIQLENWPSQVVFHPSLTSIMVLLSLD